MKERILVAAAWAVGLLLLVVVAQFMAGTFGRPGAPTLPCRGASTVADCLD